MACSVARTRLVPLLLPLPLQTVVGSNTVPFAIRARCSSGSTFNPVGNITGVFYVAPRDLSKSFVTASLGVAGAPGPQVVSYGADLPLSFAVANIPAMVLRNGLQVRDL